MPMKPTASINRRLVISLGSIVFLVMILTLGLLWGFRWDDAKESHMRTTLYPKLLLSVQIRTSVIDQQSALRGYVITGDAAFLKQMQDARATYMTARDGLTSGDSVSQELSDLRDQQIQIANDWYSRVAEPQILARQTNDVPLSEQIDILEAGDRDLDEFRAINAAYEQTIHARISTLTSNIDDVRPIIRWGGILGGLAVIGLSIMLSLHLIRMVLSPLVALQEVVADIDSGNRARRVPALPVVELDKLGGAINRMLDSLQSSGTEAEVERSRFATIVESANEGIVVVDPDGIVSDINPAACRLFDTDVATATGHPAADLGMFTEAELRMLPRQFRADDPQPLVRQRADRVLSAIISPLRTAESHGERTGSVWVLRDVTELARIDEMKNEFISVVSHELRTPLTAIKGFTDLILEGEAGDISDEQRTFLGIVQSNSDRLVALINDMLDISRIESGRISLDVDEISLPHAIQRSLATLHPLIDEKHLSVQTELDENAPVVVADEARLLQIMTNLISNACKCTPQNGWITVRTEAHEGQVAISVSDTGMGIPPDALPQVFSKFYRVDQPGSREIGGTGLGLAITKSLVEMHGGRVNIASKVGIGTTVRFTLPSAKCSENDSPSLPSPRSAPPVVLIVSPYEEDRRRWGAPIEQIPAVPIFARSQAMAAVTGEAEVHQPAVILMRSLDAGVMVQDLLQEFSAVPELDGTVFVVVGDGIDRTTSSDRLRYLPEDIPPAGVVDVVRGLLPVSTAPPPRRGRVLVAEDDQDTATWLRRILINGGYEVTIVRDGLAAIVRTIEILPDAVILDVNMPKMGASEVLPQLRSNPGTRDIPIIVVTGTVPDSRPYFMEAGASEFFAKPLDGDRLIARLVQLGKRPGNG
jgi:two-component system phosphate regulon sensor histidine kinase PhoR